MEGMNLNSNLNEVNGYLESTKLLIDGVIEQNAVKKFVLTGSASSVVGPNPEQGKDHVYSDVTAFVDESIVNKPNDRAKLLAEKYCWGKVTKYQNANPNHTLTMSAILPYFMVGPPLYHDLILTNSSCKQIQSILKNELPIYPNVSLPTVDVRDVASAHIMAALSANFASRNDRFFLSARSLWFKDMISTL